jgi:hypothetical protein
MSVFAGTMHNQQLGKVEDLIQPILNYFGVGWIPIAIQKWNYKWRSGDGMCSHRACWYFLSALSHCGRENGTQDYVYLLFAYVVSNEVDYLQKVIERDLKDDIVIQEEGEN